jgi:uncharacterized protein YndB with AHSA1/START domain
MPVNVDPSGRRWVEADVEVHGTPEQVWQAIATGPGISAWFVPTQVEERAGGSITCDFGPGMLSKSTTVAWEPPRRFVAESRDDMGPDDPTIATEWTVETLSGGRCKVRVVHSWFTTSDAWDNQYEGTVYGWQSFFRVLQIYLAHFGGQRSETFQVLATAPEPAVDAWQALTRPLGLAEAIPGQRVRASAGAPRLSGVLEHVGPAPWFEALLRLDEPAPGVAHMVPHSMNGQVYLTLRFYLYGEEAAAARQAEPAWRAWLAEQFPLAEAELDAVRT